MLTVDRAMELKAHAGEVLGSSDWLAIEQENIDAFARLTGDDHWIHVDRERASREMPRGRTIAHGLYLLSLIPRLQRQIYAIRQRGRGLNYGYDHVRFLLPVPAGSWVRLTLTLIDALPHPRGTRVETEARINLDGSDKPALAASSILLIEDE